MKPKTEELLYLLLWGVDRLMRPSFRNLTDSFEAWAYRNGFHKQLAELERRQLLERQSVAAEPAYRLSTKGWLLAVGGRDPVARWNRPWDGQWRLVIFDLPESNNTQRVRLRRFLRQHDFGYLQNSVWIRPDPLTPVLPQLHAFGQNVESLITLQAQSCAGETGDAIVAGAWDFEEINRLYEKCEMVLQQLPGLSRTAPGAANQLRRWANLERAAWFAVMGADPLLPSRLLPAGYAGQRVWELRCRTLEEAARYRDAFAG